MHIAIITGGISTEREIALGSGENMRDWIEKSGHTSEVFDFPSDLHKFLERHMSARYARNFPTRQLMKNAEKHPDFDLVIPMLHGIYGEDGQITSFIQTLGYRYAYSDPEVHALCMNKYHTNCVVEKLGIKVPKTWVPGAPFFPKLFPREGVPEIEKALIVKPNQGGSSVATTRATTREEFENGIRLIGESVKSIAEQQIKLLSTQKDKRTLDRSYTDIPMVQEYIEGREFTVGVYRDHDRYNVLPIMEVVTHDNVLFDYHEKYETDGYNEIFPELDTSLQKELENISLKIAEFLKIRGIVRMDYRYDGKDIYFLEVNTIPGFRTGSFVPKMWKKAGKTEKEFVEMLNT